VPVFHHPHC